MDHTLGGHLVELLVNVFEMPGGPFGVVLFNRFVERADSLLDPFPAPAVACAGGDVLAIALLG